MTRTASRTYKPRRENGLRQALLFEDGYGNWGWWCPRCSRPGVFIKQDGFTSEKGARKAAGRHEKRRNH